MGWICARLDLEDSRCQAIGPQPTGSETIVFSLSLLLLFFWALYTIIIPLEYIRLIQVMSFSDLAEYTRHQIGSPPFRRPSVPIVGKHQQFPPFFPNETCMGRAS